MFGIKSRFVFVLNRASVNPSTAAEIIPSVLKSGLVRGVTGTAMFSRSISPNVGRKLLMNGFPALNGLPTVLPVASW
jgi:hypothetical protein